MKWINEVHAGGGNDMKNAIVSALQKRNDATDVIVMCDGDITPFDLTSWSQFRSQYPKIRFGFVALKEESQWEKNA